MKERHSAPPARPGCEAKTGWRSKIPSKIPRGRSTGNETRERTPPGRYPGNSCNHHRDRDIVCSLLFPGNYHHPRNGDVGDGCAGISCVCRDPFHPCRGICRLLRERGPFIKSSRKFHLYPGLSSTAGGGTSSTGLKHLG